MRTAWVMVVIACGPAPAPAPAPHNAAVSHDPAVCVEREDRCDGLDCVGKRHLACTFGDGHRVEVPGEASDLRGLGGGRYRYLAWHGDKPTLVTVDGDQRTEEPGGAPRTFGPFGPYHLTAQSLDGRIAIEPVEDDDENITGLTIRDTIHGAAIGRVTPATPIRRSDRPQIVASRDARRAGLCSFHHELSLTLADRVIALPGSDCIAADAELTRVIVRTGMNELAIVELATGAATPFDGYRAAFVGTAVVAARTTKPWTRRNPPTSSALSLVVADGAPTQLGEVPFLVDDIVPTIDQASVMLLRDGADREVPSAFVIALPMVNPGRLIELPAGTVAVELVP